MAGKGSGSRVLRTVTTTLRMTALSARPSPRPSAPRRRRPSQKWKEKVIASRFKRSLKRSALASLLQVELLLRLNLIEARRPRPWGLASFGRRPLEPLPHRHPLQVCKHASTGCLERAPSAHPSCGWLARRNWQACYMRARKNHDRGRMTNTR